MKTVNDIRSEFLNFFGKKGHEIVASSPLVPQNDPTLMFANSGMVQFKNLFTGTETRPYKRATTAQKCVRAGGKHNDLENVGYTARHHTFFEMMGNFSFGDYFKEEAISYAWELVSKNFALPKDKLLVTVFHDDDEAANLWKKIAGFNDEKIIRIPTSDNFWMMGDTGPCGPCSEIFIDQGDRLQGGPPGSPDQDGDRFLEFWNLVFMQFEQEPDGKGGYIRKPLPKPSIDTGMGLERTAAIMTGKLSNYDIDLLRDIILHVADLTGVSPDGPQAASHRVIADHLRASAFLIADGVMPSNEGRGYVLRRIMRRGMRHAHLLRSQEPLMHRLVPTLTAKMGDAYPELRRASVLIIETLRTEEERFQRTLERGLKLLDEESVNVKSGGKFPGDLAFKLYDTFGFPLDLTQDVLKTKNIEVDLEAFDACMTRQKEEARKHWSGAGGNAATDKIWFELLEACGPTEFLGYESLKAEAVVKAIVKRSPPCPPASGGGDMSESSPLAHADSPPLAGGQGGEWVKTDTLYQGEEGFIITNQTPFYAESGGQVGDTGILKAFSMPSPASAIAPAPSPLREREGAQAKPGKGEGDGYGFEAAILDTKKFLNALYLHHVKLKQGEIRVSQGVELQVDALRRAAIQSNHSATHLLHEALRRVLGEHVSQKGSLQDDTRTRFDISHPKSLSQDEIKEIEAIVNAEIRTNTPVNTRLMDLDAARASGAQALFGEKYEDEVRVVSMGSRDPKRGTNVFSVELCGGTHVNATGDIGLLKIIGEGALSAGIRRIEAVTGENAIRYFTARDEILSDIAETLKSTPMEAAARVKALAEDKKKLEREVSDLRRKLATGGGGAGEPASDVKTINGVQFVGKILADIPAKDLKPMIDDYKKKLGSAVIALVSTEGGKASIAIGVTDDLTGRINAVDLVKIGAGALGGAGGGGRPDMAQAGGPDVAGAQNAVALIEKSLAG